ncbi:MULTISPECIES: hypothetical protein [Methylophaga]|uniref:hypothetical protein n=1 Tax=Methylophaga TaxID=40222 RepID=UPI000CDC9A6A|nr:hypothetical protein [Methylophaga nitratireducenticrescens]AUZ86109.1 hypothetical protein CDW43_15775 [Methylophaga nitratireducenticrescens]
MFTTRTAKITHKTEKGVLIDGLGTIDSNPDRTCIEFETLNCTKTEFLDWFLLLDESEGLCSDGVCLIDLGNTSLSLSTGSVISVSYPEMIEAWLEMKTVAAKREIAELALFASKRLFSIN